MAPLWPELRGLQTAVAIRGRFRCGGRLVRLAISPSMACLYDCRRHPLVSQKMSRAYRYCCYSSRCFAIGWPVGRVQRHHLGAPAKRSASFFCRSERAGRRYFAVSAGPDRPQNTKMDPVRRHGKCPSITPTPSDQVRWLLLLLSRLMIWWKTPLLLLGRSHHAVDAGLFQRVDG